ncbi:MAG TPA: hypothetical protein VIN05_07120 [Roseovarius sp.]
MTEFTVIEVLSTGDMENVGELTSGSEPVSGDLIIQTDESGNPSYFEVVTRVFSIEAERDQGQLIVVRLEPREGRREHYERRMRKLEK